MRLRHLAAVTASAMASLGLGDAAPPAAAATAPNLVVIMVDDMVAHMLDDLPRLRGLFSERGLSFTSAYVPAPVCCPSRASFLRGQYPHNTGVLANGPPQGGLGAFRHNGNEASTIATWLQGAGYHTALIGKYLNDYEKSLHHVPAGWHRWFAYAGKGKYRAFRVSDQGKVRQYGKDKDKARKGRKGRKHKDKHKRRKKDYQTDVLARKAAGFIHETPAGQPLFLYLAPSAPHEPATPAERHKKAGVARATAPRRPSYNEADVSDKPGAWRHYGPVSGKRQRDADKVYVKQQKSLFAVEDMIQDVYDALAATNRLANTFLFFVSDNGYHHGEHRVVLDKNTPFEESALTPLIVVGPGVPAGATSDALVSLVDFGPTLADLAGVVAPEFVDGRSLVPLLDGGTPSGWRDAVISELLHGAAGGFTLLRTGDYAYTAYGNGERELYNLHDDPYQLDNIAGSADQSLLDQLEARYDALATCGIEGAHTCQDVDGG